MRTANPALSPNAFATRDPATVAPYLLGGVIGGLVMALVTVFKKEWSPVTAPLYALLEGLVLGSVSAMFELRFPGIAMESVALTFGTCLVILVAYRSRLIRATQKFTHHGSYNATPKTALERMPAGEFAAKALEKQTSNQVARSDSIEVDALDKPPMSAVDKLAKCFHREQFWIDFVMPL